MSPLAASPPISVKRVAEHFAEELRRRFGQAVVDVRLFGSHARGQGNEDSDVDIAVVLESVDWKTRTAVIDLATDTGLPHDLHLSPSVFDRQTYERWRRQQRPLVTDIEQEGISL